MLLRYFLNDSKMAAFVPIINGITFVFTFHIHDISIVRFLTSEKLFSFFLDPINSY